MVFFVCDGCQETLKKNAVDKHAFRCRGCVSVTCVDCGVSFAGNDYAAHITCISEAEKYEKGLFKPKAKTAKRDPQAEWTEYIAQAANKPGIQHRDLLQRLLGYTNVPRKLKPFVNFAKNSLNVRNDGLLEQLFGIIQSVMPPRPPPVAANKDAVGAGAGKGDAAGSDDDSGGSDSDEAKKTKKQKKQSKKSSSDDDSESSSSTDDKARKKQKEEKHSHKRKRSDAGEEETRAAVSIPSSSSSKANVDIKKGNATQKEEKEEPEFDFKKYILNTLRAATVVKGSGDEEAGRVKAKRMRKQVIEQAVKTKGMSGQKAKEKYENKLASLVEKGKIITDGKFLLTGGK